jgi:hypothetical protein
MADGLKDISMAAGKGSTISGIFGSYRNALNFSQDRYRNLYTERADNAVEFYRTFLNQLIVGFDGFKDDALRRSVRRDLLTFFDRDEIQFVSIDGTCKKDPFADFMVFSSIAYGVRGKVSLQGDPPTLRYERRSMEEDVSFVAYVPVPFAEITDVTNSSKFEDFIVTDQDKVDLSDIHNGLMQLAEVYLAYEMARSSSPDRPRLILMDHSPSSILASTDIGSANIGMVGYKSGKKSLDSGDVHVVFSHPFNEDLDLPSTKNFRLYGSLIAEVVKNRNQPVNVLKWTTDLGLKIEHVERQFQRNSKAIATLGDYNHSTKIFHPKFNFSQSWWESVRIFEDICRRLFREKDQEALLYEVPDEDDSSKLRQRWLSPEDIKFLVAIGLRALIEECWRNKIMLIGLVKDSSSRYFSRNYYGLMRHTRFYPDFPIKPLPWTDRILLEDVAHEVNEISDPWTTIEFDSCFMTLHAGISEGETTPKPMGVKGDVVNQERLFARSLAQFFLRRGLGKSSPLMGHVIFVDRLLQPSWDKGLCTELSVYDTTPRGLGGITPFIHRDRNSDNLGQRVAMFLLNTLTRNLFPEAIGYPDPLHKADQGAKTVGRRVARVIADSEISFRANPISKSFRSIRDARKR